MRLPRFRVRTLMIAVALVAFALAAPRAWRHHRYCIHCAGFYAQLEASYKQRQVIWERVEDRYIARIKMYYNDSEKDEEIKSLESTLYRHSYLFNKHIIIMNYYSRQAKRYERAAWRPWLPVPPDPPEPK